jgi:riboflavin transporter FmnP
VGRWLAVGLPCWLILLAAFNQNISGIPWTAGLLMATLLAGAITLYADRRTFGAARGAPLGPLARVVVLWLVVWGLLALFISTSTHAGFAATVVVPFLVATVVAGGVELSRRALGHR